jgi:Immunity protein Imm1
VTVAVEVEWCGEDGRYQRSTANDADAAVATLRRVDSMGYPVLVDFVRDAGQSLTIGVGSDEAVVCFQSSHNGPNFWSVGEAAAGTAVFAYGGEESEFLRRQLVPRTVAEIALREFVETGETPTLVEWEAV